MIFLRIIKEGVIMALQSLWNNRLRTFLSLLGISIGIFCVISVLCAVDSFERYIKGSFDRLGNDLVLVSRESWANPGGDWWKYLKRPYTNFKEFKALNEKSETAEEIAIRVMLRSKKLSYKDNSITNTNLIGFSHDYGSMFDFVMSEGRYLTPMESQLGKNLAILGYNLAQELFPKGAYPIGKEIKFMGRKLKVVGVLEKEGESVLGDGLDNMAFIPYNYLRKYMDVNSKSMIPAIALRPYPSVSVAEMKDEVRGILRAQRYLKPTEEDNFSLNETSILKMLIDNTFFIINAAGWVIGLFSILVGGFGIANIMFVSVRERTPIIGVKKSLGAKNHFILFEFLIESIVLTILGGLIGLALVYLLIAVQNWAQLVEFEFVLSYENLLIGMGVSAVIGVVSGIIPAIYASGLNPVDAIRR